MRAPLPGCFCAICMCCGVSFLPFAIRVCMNPLLFLFVFTFVIPHMSAGAAMNPTGSDGRRGFQHGSACRA